MCLRLTIHPSYGLTSACQVTFIIPLLKEGWACLCKLFLQFLVNNIKKTLKMSFGKTNGCEFFLVAFSNMRSRRQF